MLLYEEKPVHITKKRLEHNLQVQTLIIILDPSQLFQHVPPAVGSKPVGTSVPLHNCDQEPLQQQQIQKPQTLERWQKHKKDWQIYGMGQDREVPAAVIQLIGTRQRWEEEGRRK